MNDNRDMKRGAHEGKVKGAAMRETYDWVHSIMTALIACILLFIFIGRGVDVFGASMEPTLHEGDKLVVSDAFYSPKNGDVVILSAEGFNEESLVKRVIAVGGQTVDIDFENGIVYVDGVALDEPYIKELTNRRLDFDGEITVPEGCVFVMGDNRNNSSDSRDERIGCVDERAIIGKVYLRFFPFSDFAKIK